MSRRRLHRWHRRAGVAAAGFLLFLLLTGVPLQFSGSLDLGSRYVAVDALLDWYGLEAPTAVLGDHGLVAVGDDLFTAPSGAYTGSLRGFRGAVNVDGLTVAAGGRNVLLLAPGFDRPLDRFHLPADVQRIGRYRDRVAVETSDGILLADAEFVDWQTAAIEPSVVAWSRPRPPPDGERYRQRFRHRMLTVERLLQDAHSGRLLGTAGVVLVDVAGVLLVFLAGSGLVMWQRTRR